MAVPRRASLLSFLSVRKPAEVYLVHAATVGTAGPGRDVDIRAAVEIANRGPTTGMCLPGSGKADDAEGGHSKASHQESRTKLVNDGHLGLH